MRVKYLTTEELTAESLSQEIGAKILSITIGSIETAEPQEGLDDEGNITATVAMKEGLEIEFEEEPTSEQLKKLDMQLIGYKRDGGKSLADKIAEIEAKIKTLGTKG